MKKVFFILCFAFSQNSNQQIDGIAAVVEQHIVLKSDLAQMVNMAAMQNKIDPIKNKEKFIGHNQVL